MRPFRRWLDLDTENRDGHGFGITPSAHLATPHAVVNTAPIDDRLGNVGKQQAVAMTSGYAICSPPVLKEE